MNNQILRLENNYLKIDGLVRTIECDGLKYPTQEALEWAVKNGKAIISEWHRNLITNAGKYAIARRLINEGLYASEGTITYGVVGTNTTAPAATDTQLGTELFRKVLAQTSRTNNTITLKMFMTTSEGNGTLKEFGWAGEAATGAADSGTLYNHIAINKAKSTSITLQIEQSITIT